MVTVLLVSLVMLTLVAGIDRVRGRLAADLAPRPGLERRPLGGRGRPRRLPLPPERERPVLPLQLLEPARQRTANQAFSPRYGSRRAERPSGNAQFRYSTDTSFLTSQGAIIVTSTGRSRNATRTIQATLRRHSFIDYLYFTDYETTDPALYPTGEQQQQRGLGTDALRPALLRGPQQLVHRHQLRQRRRDQRAAALERRDPDLRQPARSSATSRPAGRLSGNP